MSTEPPIGVEMPPPVCPKVACTCVKRLRLSAGIPRWSTDQTTIASTATAPNAATVATTSATRLVTRRRRARPCAFRGRGAFAASTSVPPLDCVTSNDDLCREVLHQQHDDKNGAQVEERRDLEVRHRALVLGGDAAREGVTGLEQVERDVGGDAD